MRNPCVACVLWGLFCAGLAGCSGPAPNSAAEKLAAPEAVGEPVVLAIEGMHCDGCANAIAEAVQALSGVHSVKVSFQDKQAVIVPAKGSFDQAAVLATIKKLGYDALPPGATPPAGTPSGT